MAQASPNNTLFFLVRWGELGKVVGDEALSVDVVGDIYVNWQGIFVFHGTLNGVRFTFE